MLFHAILAAVCPIGDPRRIFNQGTPAGLWHLVAEICTTVVGHQATSTFPMILRDGKWCAKKSSKPRGALCQTKISALAIAHVGFTARGNERQNWWSAIGREPFNRSFQFTPGLKAPMNPSWEVWRSVAVEQYESKIQHHRIITKSPHLRFCLQTKHDVEVLSSSF